MNAQNSDSFSPEATSPLPEVMKTPSITTKEHKGVLDILGGFWHKKGSEKLPTKEAITPTVTSPEGVPAPADTPETATKLQDPLLVSEKIDPSPVSEKAQNDSEKPFVLDEKFARLLKHDSTYHSMIRSEDLKNIQLQLSMRYMLLMLAIFVVIAWVVNNRVIMFGFSDFPLLARSRDALFTILTGLFSLTVWFGSVVWFRHRMGVIIVRIIGCVLFASVIISVYLPFWR